MSKSSRIYKIFMATMIVAIAGMLLAMGIIAAQKTMKLGVQFSSNPNYKLEVFINNEQTLIFRNFADNETGKAVKMDNGITSLNGDTLVADEEAFKGYGNDFTIIIKNYTEATGIKIDMESTAKIDSGADGIPAQIEAIKNTASKYDPDAKIADSVSFRVYVNSVFPQTTTLKMTISEYNVYNLSFSGAVTNTPSEMVAGESYTTTITPNPNYKLPDTITVKQDGVTLTMGTHYSWNPENGQLEIFEVTGEILITCDAILSECTITFDWNNDVDGLAVTYDGNTNPPSTTTYTPGVSQALPNPTKVGCEFLGWTYPGQTEPQKDLNANTLSGDLTLTANWGATLLDGATVFKQIWNEFRGDNPAFTFNNSTSPNNGTMAYAGDFRYKYDSSLQSITFDYWSSKYTSESYSFAYGEDGDGIALDIDGRGSIMLFKKDNDAYILSPNKILGNMDCSNLFCGQFAVLDTRSQYCHSALTSLKLNNFDTSKTSNMSNMFYGSYLTTLDVSSFNTSNVTNMYSMFASCSSLTSLDLSSFDTSSLIDMSHMFSFSDFVSLDLGNFNTTSVTNMSYTFYYNSGLKTIYSGINWSTANLTSSEGLFYDCRSLVGGNGTPCGSSGDASYARIDTAETPGYFTYKSY